MTPTLGPLYMGLGVLLGIYGAKMRIEKPHEILDWILGLVAIGTGIVLVFLAVTTPGM